MQFDQLGRREVITLLGGAAAWPLAARAEGERVRRVGLLLNLASDDPEGHARIAAFQQGLQKLGWVVGRNLQIDARWAGADVGLFTRYAGELVGAAPDILLASTSQALASLLQATRTVPIVFVQVVDPVGAGYVESLARPRGNATGFLMYEYSIAGKWLELLNEIAPGVTRVAVLRDPATAAGIGQYAAVQAVSHIRVALSPIDVRNAAEIERGVSALARESNGGLVVTGSPPQAVHRELILALAARYRLPAVYAFRYMAVGGGLISYGPDPIDAYRQGVGYVDRILKGEKPADLPVQAPTKYELVINLKTAKALGLTVPDTLLARADEVIE
jgi:putative ABC transport system substrate-binding protein